MKKLLIGLIIIFLIIFAVAEIYVYYKNKENEPVLIDNEHDATQELEFDDKLKVSEYNNNMSFSCSFWLYINNWDLINPRKKRFVMKYNSPNGGFDILLGNNQTSKHNDMTIRLTTHSRKYETITVKDIKLQKWMHICFVVENRNMDVFVNSKMYKSIKLAGIPILEEEGKLIISPNGGFKGLIKKFQYFNRKIGLSKINSLYKN